MKNKWKSLVMPRECCQILLLIGIGLALYEQQWWPAFIIGAISALGAFIIAWSINHD